MNFVIFPMFFMSTALYPLWKMKESSVLLSKLAQYNPFSQAVELIRFALYGSLTSMLLFIPWLLFWFLWWRQSLAITHQRNDGEKGGAKVTRNK